MSGFNLFSIVKENSTFKTEDIEIGCIIPSQYNFYAVNDIEQLKEAIRDHGLQQPPVVRGVENGLYEIISGHRRIMAMQELCAEGYDQFQTVPCKVEIDIDDTEAEILLIQANATTRVLTPYEQMKQIERTKEITERMKKAQGIKGNTREIVAETLNTSASEVARMESINHNLSDELKEEFKQNKIGKSAAAELATLPKAGQDEALTAYKDKGDISINEVKEIKEKYKPPKNVTIGEVVTEQPAPEPPAEMRERSVQGWAWANDLDILEKRGIDKGLLQKLRDMGPYASTEIAAITSMTDAELQKYQELWKAQSAISIEPPQIKIDHKLKIHPEPFAAVESGLKTFEFRYDDRGYKVGDILSLCEYLPDDKQFTGKFINVRVIYITAGGFGLPLGYVIMSVEKTEVYSKDIARQVRWLYDNKPPTEVEPFAFMACECPTCGAEIPLADYCLWCGQKLSRGE